MAGATSKPCAATFVRQRQDVAELIGGVAPEMPRGGL